MDFRVQLDVFRGPLDLLLFLVRKHEVDVCDLPIALITEQYLAHLEVLQQLDVNEVGDFLELASTLIEIKSQLVLPRGGEEAEAWDDPRDELVERLLEYKKYKDAASMLDERSRDWQQHYPRLASDLAAAASRSGGPADPRGGAVGPGERDGPHPARIAGGAARRRSSMTTRRSRSTCSGFTASWSKERRVAFSDMFEPGMHKSAIVGVFLAVLELARHHSVRTEQNDLHGEIWIVPGEEFDPAQEIAAATTTSAQG